MFLRTLLILCTFTLLGCETVPNKKEPPKVEYAK
jgi:hypothetical protein